MQSLALRAAEKGLALRTQYASDIPAQVSSDPYRLRQITVNLVGNAVKFTQAGRVSFRASHVRDMAVFEIEGVQSVGSS